LQDSASGGLGSASVRTRIPRALRKVARKESVWAVVFLTPALVTILMTRVWPGLGAVVSSLYSGIPGGVRVERFVGLENYVRLFENEAFIDVLWRTVVFNLVINPFQVGLALLLALVMVRKMPLRGVLRTLLFLPATVPIVGSTIAWGVALRPDGPVNSVLSAIGGTPQPFFTSPQQSLATVIIIASWIGVGYWMIFLIAGIEAIPEEYYEAAKLDRAGPLRTFFAITLPQLKRPVLFVLVACTVANFVLFVPIALLTEGGPQNSSTTLMFDAYRTTFVYGSRNLGAAEVVILSSVMIAFVVLQFKLLGEEKEPQEMKAKR